MELLYRERTVVIRNKGSIQFAEDEIGSDIVLIDVKCEALGGTNYYNTKSLPPYGFYGTVTLFGGATVKQRIPLEFVYQRVVDFESDYRRLRCYLTKLEQMLQFIGDTVSSPPRTPPAGGDPRDSFEYRGLPYSKLKINSERPAQWTITVRAYTENDLQCQSVVNADDPTKGEDEYPSPLPINPNGQFPASLGEPTLPYPGADPNDFDEIPPGSWTPKRLYFGLQIKAWDGNQAQNCSPNLTFFENVIWDTAGPPPYTTRNAGLPSPCANAGNGYIIVAADGTESPVYNGGGTTYEANINVFQYNPFS